MPIALILVAAAVVKKALDFVKYARNGHLNGIVTSLVAVGAGIVATFLTTAQTSLLAALHAGTLTNLDGVGKTLLGLAVAALASHLHDFTKVFDRTQTAAIPPLVKTLPAVPFQQAP